MNILLRVFSSILGKVTEGDIGSVGIPGALAQMELAGVGRGSDLDAGYSQFVTPSTIGGSSEELACGVAGIDDGFS